MMDWNVRKKRWWFGYGFRGGEDDVDYIYGLYDEVHIKCFLQTHNIVRIFSPSNGSSWLIGFFLLMNTYMLTRD
jgi:hypothetical protein